MSNNMSIKNVDDLRKIIEDIYKRINEGSLKKNPSSFTEEREKIINDVISVFNQVLLNEKASYDDVEYLGMGATSYVFAVNSKVVKIGSGRYTNSIRNNPYILQPIYRKSLEFDGDIKEGLFVEVTERVKACKDYNDVSEEELYQLYANFRDIGLEWVDIEPRNVGRLLNDNIVHWSLPSVFENDYSESEEFDEIRKAGDLVVLDTDFIYEGMAPEELFNAYEDDEWDFIPTARNYRLRYEYDKFVR